MFRRIVFYSAFAGFVIGFFARVTYNPILRALATMGGCLTGAGPYGNAIYLVAPQTAVLYGIGGSLLSLGIWLVRQVTKPRRVVLPKIQSRLFLK